jgi:hypothetical protein
MTKPRSTLQVCKTWEKHTLIYSVNLNRGDSFEYIGIDGRIISKFGPQKNTV